MSSTTIRVKQEEKERLDYYKGVFGFSGMEDLVKAILDRSGMMSLEEIKRLRVTQRIRPISAEDEEE